MYLSREMGRFEVKDLSSRRGDRKRWPLETMSPELETLDQLQGGDLILNTIRGLFPDAERFKHGITAMLDAGELRLLDLESNAIPLWKHAEILDQFKDPTALQLYRLSLTDAGAARLQ